MCIVITKGSPEQIQEFLKQGVLETIIYLLLIEDMELHLLLLEAFINIFGLCADSPQTSQYVMGVINNSNAVKRLEKFLLLKNDDVFNMTNQVLETINSYSQVTAESGESA